MGRLHIVLIGACAGEGGMELDLHRGKQNFCCTHADTTYLNDNKEFFQPSRLAPLSSKGFLHHGLPMGRHASHIRHFDGKKITPSPSCVFSIFLIISRKQPACNCFDAGLHNELQIDQPGGTRSCNLLFRQKWRLGWRIPWKIQASLKGNLAGVSGGAVGGGKGDQEDRLLWCP
jgi:hypothetical protein